MRNFWAGIGRITCHCHCYICIENRHLQVRKLSVALARIRSGPPCYLGVGTSTTPHRRYLRQSSDLRPFIEREDDKQANSEDATTDERPAKGERFTITKHLSGSQKYAAGDRAAEGHRRRREEEELSQAASELQSLSIDHWSLDDVVTYEPMPGGRKPPKVPSTTTADPNCMMPQSPWAPDMLKRQNYARFWTRKKIAKMETSVAQFAVRICKLLDLHSQWPSNLIVLPEALRSFAKATAEEQDYLESRLGKRLKVLRNRYGTVASHDPPEAPADLAPFIPMYEHNEDGLHHELLRDLNASLVELFEGYKSQQLNLNTLLVKICHNLLVSTAPPNVQTMNILLLGFYSSDKYVKNSSAASQVRHVILDWLIAICYMVKIRPNEITCATVLATYRRRGMRGEFAKFVHRMRGTGGPLALMYTKALTLRPENTPRLIPTENDPLIFKQAVYPSPMIFAEVIKGVAKFYTLEDAITVCKDFTAKEWGYDWSCLHYLLNACIVQKDWRSGLWVWSEIKAFWKAGHEEPIRILAAMLALCVQCQEKEMFAEVLTYSTGRLKSISQPAFIDIATDILNRAVEKMDEEELLALEEQGAAEGAREERVPSLHSAKLRLENDPAFKYAVFGLGHAAMEAGEAKETDRRYLDDLEVGERYENREQELGQRDTEPVGVNGILQGLDETSLSRNPVDGEEQNLLRQAEGGADVDLEDTESNMGEAANAGLGFGSSPMDMDETTPYDPSVRKRGRS